MNSDPNPYYRVFLENATSQATGVFVGVKVRSNGHAPGSRCNACPADDAMHVQQMMLCPADDAMSSG